MKHKLMSTMLLGTFLGLGFLNSNAQMHINGPTSFGSSSFATSFGNLSFGADAQVVFMDGATFYMLGANTTVNSGAEFYANTLSGTTGTGRILFQGTAPQTLDGGNSSAIGGPQPSLINIAVNNPDNLTLTNTNTRVTSGLDFINGHVILGSNGLELSSTATASNANGTRHVVTNGTGFMAKEGIAANAAFSFPVGRATSDFTPATVTPTGSDNFFVQVKDYTESASEETVPDNGVYRTWNIYSTGGAGANILLQHNTTTNGGDYNTNGADAVAFVTQYQGFQWVTSAQQNQGVWQIGTGAGITDAPGSLGGSRVHNRDYTATATSSTSNAAFFSKSNNILTPLPITLLDFTATKKEENKALLTWSTTSEINSSHFDVETSTNGLSWTRIGEVKAQGVSYELSNYQLIHTNPALGVNYYRLNLVDLDGSAEFSKIRSLLFGNVTSTLANVVVFPNPSNGMLNISSLNKSNNYILTDMHGKTIHSFNNTSENSDFQVDLSSYANGVYFIKANSQNGEVKTFKIVLNK